MGFKFLLRLEDGEPSDPAVLVTAVPNWTVGETFSTGRGHEWRILAIIDVRVDELVDQGINAAILEVEPVATLGRNEEAQQALERSRELTIPEDVVDVIGLDALEAVLRARRGELEEGQELARRALARAEETDHVGMRLDARWSAAEVFERAGRGDEAKALLEESVEIAERYGHLVAARRARERLKDAFT